MNAPKFTTLDINQIKLDSQNTRIKQFLENYVGEPTSEQISLALSDSGTGDATTSYRTLRESIRVSKGIIHPIVVNHTAEGEMVVIEGNTRLQIYKEFNESNPDGTWAMIPSLLYEQMSEYDIHSIRLQSHLVGPRDWDPYSKAKYLFQLSEVEYLPMSQIISLCGGKSNEITKSIDAYKCMEGAYRKYVEDNELDFEPREFSKFMEYQNPRIKNAVANAGYTIDTFAEWVAEGNIDKAQGVRNLPDILKSDKAKAVFLKKNISEAEKILAVENSEQAPKGLDKIPYDILCNELITRFDNLGFREVKALATEQSYAKKRDAIWSLSDMLLEMIDNIHRFES